MEKTKMPAFKDGVVLIYSARDVADVGDMPDVKLSQKYKLCFDERIVGIARYESGMMDNTKIDMLIRTPRLEDVTTRDWAVINNGKCAYKIVRVQYPEDIMPEVMDLSLERVESGYRISV